ncbi:MAG: hypothetical protein QOI95_2785 [Acidimicrobiaceae bacterium]|jgi:hypothetical protein
MSLASHARLARPTVVALSALALFVIAGCGSSDNKPTATSQTSATSQATTGSSSSSTAPAGTLIEIIVAGGQAAGGVKHVDVGVGKSVTVRITSDVAEEIHIHGYDLKQDLTPGVPAEITFTADIPGVFEIELEHSGLKVAELQVG